MIIRTWRDKRSKFSTNFPSLSC